MSNDKSDDPLGLVIPINLEAFCVGTLDANGEASPVTKFAGSTTSYLDLNNPELNAFIGDNVNIPFTETPVTPLKAGIHLHWALPDALTKAQNNQGVLQFPAVPNRWLVTRFYNLEQNEPSKVTIKSWVVESDVLLTPQDTPNSTSVTLPVTPLTQHGTTYNSCYLGRSEKLSNWPASDPGYSIETYTGSPLTAVCSGVISFASYYPDSSSVFGFYDPLTDSDDPQPDGNTPVSLMYTVIGWYSDPTYDPLNKGMNLAEIQTAYQWSFTGPDTTVSFTNYYGIVQDINWNTNITYVTPSSLQPIDATVTIGNSPEEVTSSYLRLQNCSQSPLFEKLTHLFQREKLLQFSQPRVNQALKISDDLYQNQFSKIDAGTIYSIVKAATVDASPSEECINLPLLLADALNQLNVSQQQLDFYQFHQQSVQEQLFLDWYHLFKLSSEDALNTAEDVISQIRIPSCTQIQQNMTTYSTNFSNALQAVQQQIGDSLTLISEPAPRYLQPTEPVVAIASNALDFPKRYGGDNSYSEDNYLMCRLPNQLLTCLSVNNTAIPASQFSTVVLPSGTQLPYVTIFNALLQESCLLNTELAASISKLTDSSLEQNLQMLLNGQTQSVYSSIVGEIPSCVMMTWWDKVNMQNPWLPLFMQWSVDILPVQPDATSSETIQNFFNANYTINPTDNTYMNYTPNGKSGSVSVDPTNSNSFTSDYYSGSAVLSPVSSANLAKKLTAAMRLNEDSTFKTLLDKLQASPVMVQPLSGFNKALLMRKQLLQLPVQVSGGPYATLTAQVKPLVGDMNQVGLDINGYFNPIRSSYLKLNLTVVDVFGQKRDLNFSSLNCSSSMTTTFQGKPVPGVAYLPPRISQPSRLLFQWVAADSSGIEEMNSHPATSPICGWFMPNHIDNRSMFVYNQQGTMLGILYLIESESTTTVGWQSAPGDNSTIDDTIEVALQYENPQLASTAIALKNGSVAIFQAFMSAMDTISSSLSPSTVSSKSNIATLVGLPVALVQSYLRWEVQGNPAVDQAAACYQSQGNYNETDRGLTEVNFPVILGNLNQGNDGLIGYFMQPSSQDYTTSSYDFNTFYTTGSTPNESVINPVQGTLNLTITPQFDDNDPEPPDMDSCIVKLLMLVDPRAPIHAITGVLPSATLQLPSDQWSDAVSKLDMSFLVAPVLQGNQGLALPLCPENGYQWSWVEEINNSGTKTWMVNPSIASFINQAVANYTPQQIREGWLRLNPSLLDFSLLNTSSQKPFVVPGKSNSLALVIKNTKPIPISFTPGKLVAEGTVTNSASILYIHFGNMVEQSDVPNIQLSATNWSFKCFNSSFYGSYWAAVSTNPSAVLLNSNDTLTINMANVNVASSSKLQFLVYVDYYQVEGINDGVFDIIVQSSSSS